MAPLLTLSFSIIQFLYIDIWQYQTDAKYPMDILGISLNFFGRITYKFFFSHLICDIYISFYTVLLSPWLEQLFSSSLLCFWLRVWLCVYLKRGVKCYSQWIEMLLILRLSCSTWIELVSNSHRKFNPTDWTTYTSY